MCLQYRWGVFKGMYDAIAQNEGGLDTFSQGERLRVCCCLSRVRSTVLTAGCVTRVQEVWAQPRGAEREDWHHLPGVGARCQGEMLCAGL